MSCIDSAIIRALVEHIGMNPDEIPTTGGTSSGTSIDLGQLGTKIVSTSTFGTVYGAENCMICDYHSSYDARLSVGAVLRLETIAGEIETYICFSNEIEFEFMNIKDTSKTLKFSSLYSSSCRQMDNNWINIHHIHKILIIFDGQITYM